VGAPAARYRLAKATEAAMKLALDDNWNGREVAASWPAFAVPVVENIADLTVVGSSWAVRR